MPSIALPVSLRGQLLSGSRFNPISLFSAGEQGIWLDPSDLTTMFQDRAGTTPVTTPGQTVGLRLDKSKGLVLGSELVTNGDFSGGSTGWSTQAGWAISGGTANATTVAAANVSQLGILTVGKYYKISFTISNFTAGFGAILVITPNFVNVLGNGTYTVQGFANSTAFQVYAGPNSSFSVDNISVKEIPGNHAVAPTDAARPTYGIEPKTGRRNLLTRTEEFGDAVWGKNLVTITSNFDIAPDGTATADRFISAGGSFPQIAESQSLVAGQPYTFSAWVKSDGTAQIAQALLLESGVTAFTPTSTWTRVSVSIASSAGGSKAAVIATNSGAAATSSFLIWGAQLELGSTATAYQRVGTAFDVTEAGVPTVHYVQYDGTDDSFSTSSIDFTATDKMSVFAGVRKLSDAAQGVLAELSATIVSNNGSFLLAAPDGATATFGFDSKGTAQVDAVASSLTAPITRLVTGLADIAGDTATIRINGVQADQDTGDQGTGNYGNYPLFIGRRNNASNPSFNGRDYGIIIVGKTASATEITNTESYLAANTSGVSI